MPSLRHLLGNMHIAPTLWLESEEFGRMLGVEEERVLVLERSVP